MQGSAAPLPDQGQPDSPDVVTEEPIAPQDGDARLPDEPQAPAPAAKPEGATPSADKAATKDGDAKQDDEPKTGSATRRRIDRLTRELRDAQREAAYERGLREGTERARAQQQAPGSAAPAADEKPKLDDYDSAEEYAEALADWKVRQKDADKSKASAAPQQGDPATPREPARAGDTPNDVRAKSYLAAKAKFPDIDEVLTDSTITFTMAMADAVADDEDSAEILYQLGQDPDEVARISKLPPKQQEREVWRFADKYRAGQTSQPETPAEPDPDDEDDGEEPRAKAQPRAQVSKAGPVPPKLSGSRGGAATTNLADLPQEEYERVMNERERKRGR